MTIETMSLWQAIDSLAQQVPFGKEKIERILSINLHEKRRSANTIFLEGGEVSPGQGWHVARVDLRLGIEADDPGFLVLELDGACTTIEQVKARYSPLKITGVPTGRSPNEETSHSKEMTWGRLSFGFAERNPACLASVVFAPAKTNK